jgi:hypothetical protein
VAAGGVVLGGECQGGLHEKKPGTITAEQQDAFSVGCRPAA